MHAVVDGAEDHGFKWSDLEVFVVVDFVQDVKRYDSL